MGTGGYRYGAGRPGWRAKAEGCLRLDVRALARRHILGATGSTIWRWMNTYSGEEAGAVQIVGSPVALHLHYSVNGTPIVESILIERTACHFGGTRPWLRCPRCSRRAAVLYLRSRRFVCRTCGCVAYASQSEDVIGRAWRAQWKLEAKLGDHWTRPKGMHRRTWQRIIERISGCEEVRDDALCAYLARRPELLDLTR